MDWRLALASLQLQLDGLRQSSSASAALSATGPTWTPYDRQPNTTGGGTSSLAPSLTAPQGYSWPNYSPGGALFPPLIPPHHLQLPAGNLDAGATSVAAADSAQASNNNNNNNSMNFDHFQLKSNVSMAPPPPTGLPHLLSSTAGLYPLPPLPPFSWRDLEHLKTSSTNSSINHVLSPRLTASTTAAAVCNSLFSPLGGKKRGRWCAMHVRIAWEIHMSRLHRQQQQQQSKSPQHSATSAGVRSNSYCRAKSSTSEFGPPSTSGEPRCHTGSSCDENPIGLAPYKNSSPAGVGRELNLNAPPNSLFDLLPLHGMTSSLLRNLPSGSAGLGSLPGLSFLELLAGGQSQSNFSLAGSTIQSAVAAAAAAAAEAGLNCGGRTVGLGSAALELSRLVEERSTSSAGGTSWSAFAGSDSLLSGRIQPPAARSASRLQELSGSNSLQSERCKTPPADSLLQCKGTWNESLQTSLGNNSTESHLLQQQQHYSSLSLSPSAQQHVPLYDVNADTASTTGSTMDGLASNVRSNGSPWRRHSPAAVGPDSTTTPRDTTAANAGVSVVDCWSSTSGTLSSTSSSSGADEHLNSTTTDHLKRHNAPKNSRSNTPEAVVVDAARTNKNSLPENKDKRSSKPQVWNPFLQENVDASETARSPNPSLPWDHVSDSFKFTLHTPKRTVDPQHAVNVHNSSMKRASAAPVSGGSDDGCHNLAVKKKKRKHTPPSSSAEASTELSLPVATTDDMKTFLKAPSPREEEEAADCRAATQSPSSSTTESRAAEKHRQASSTGDDESAAGKSSKESINAVRTTCTPDSSCCVPGDITTAGSISVSSVGNVAETAADETKRSKLTETTSNALTDDNTKDYMEADQIALVELVATAN